MPRDAGRITPTRLNLPPLPAHPTPERIGTPFAFAAVEGASSTGMSTRRVGLWLIGAFGGVGSTAALGLAALSRGLTDTTALTTALPFFEGADLGPFPAFVLGGHDIRRSSFHQAAMDLHLRANVFEPGTI